MLGVNGTATAPASLRSRLSEMKRPPDTGEEARCELPAEARLTLRRIQEDGESLSDGGGVARLGVLFRNVHTYKSLMAFAGVELPGCLASELEQYLASLWHGRLPFNEEAVELVGRAVQSLVRMDGTSSSPGGASGNSSVLAEMRAGSAGGRTPAEKSAGFPRGEANSQGPANPDGRQPQSQPACQMAPPPATGAGCRELAEIESLSANLTRLLGRLQDMTADSQDERLQALVQAMRRNLEQIRLAIHQQRYTSVRAFFLPMVATVQQLASRYGKRVAVRLQVEDVEADKTVIQALRPSIIHILRNCVAHGVETPAERVAAGKQETGSITVAADVSDHCLHVAISDDGRGFDTAAIRASAVRMGAVSPERAALTDDKRASLLAFVPGLSTNATADELSGYGMGLTTVAEDVAALGGQVSVESQPGRGASLVLQLPLP